MGRTHYNFCIYSPIDGCSDCFLFGAIVNEMAVDMCLSHRGDT